MKTTQQIKSFISIKHFLFAILAFVICAQVYSQKSEIPADLKQRFYAAKNRGNVELAKQLNNEIEQYLDKITSEPDDPKNYRFIEPGQKSQMETDWYVNEVIISASPVGYYGHKQMEIKQGPDGNLYMAFISRNAGSPWGIQTYISTNGGANWVFLGGVGSNDIILSVSLLVESRNNNVQDSTRFFVYYTSSSDPLGNDAKLKVYSRKVSGGLMINQTVAAPSAGNKYEFISACSDGEYWSEVTFLHVIAREVTNSNTLVGFRHFRTSDWGKTYTHALLATGQNDNYPSAGFLRKYGDDRIYIAIERKLPSGEASLMLNTSDEPNSGFFYGLINSAGNYGYEKPNLTISQRNTNGDNTILVSCTKNGAPVYFYSTNRGSSWSPEQVLINQNNFKYTHCSSDSLSAGGNNFVITCMTSDADSILVYQGAPGNMNLTGSKINTQLSTEYISPASVVYKKGSSLSAGIVYAGLSRTNIFYNGSHLLIGIQNINSNIPSGFNLSQNYPNPFNPVTNIEFSIPKAGNVKLAVYDITGKQIDELVNSQMNAGTYRADFNAGSLSSGIYFYTLETDGFKQTKKMILVK